MRERDPELDRIFAGDPGLRRAADSVRAAMSTPLAGSEMDPAFRSDLRRRLMREAYGRHERPRRAWRGFFAGPRLALSGAVAGIALVAFAVYSQSGQTGRDQQVLITSPFANASTVALQDPIPVAFSQPMDRPSVEQAIRIEPPTQVAYQWSGNTLLVQPVAGELAPNTQYTVRLAPTAKTAGGQPIPTGREFTFTTSAPPGPVAVTTPPPGPARGLADERQVAPAGSVLSIAGWSKDSLRLWLVSAANGAYSVYADGSGGGPAGGSGATAPTSAVISADGSRLGYIRHGGGGISFLDHSRPTYDFAPEPVAIGWAGDRLLTLTGQAVTAQQPGPAAGAAAPQVAPTSPLPPVTPTPGATGLATPSPSASPSPSPSVPALARTQEPAAAAWFSPTGTAIVYRTAAGAFHELDIPSGKDTSFGSSATSSFLAWSPDGARTISVAGGDVVIGDALGQMQARVALSDLGSAAPAAISAAASPGGQLLIATHSALYTAGMDGTALRRLADGVVDAPSWPPGGSRFAYFRDNGKGPEVWTAAIAAAPPVPALSDASKALSQFMTARVSGSADGALALADASGKAAYQQPGMSLVYPAEPRLTRQYTVFAQALPGTPSRVRFLVRLVLDRSNKDAERFDELITLAAQPGGGYLVDAATAMPHLPAGTGPELLSVAVDGGHLKLTFDSDLDAITAARAVTVTDPAQKPVQVTPSAAGRTLSLDVPEAVRNAGFTVSVGDSLKDVAGRSAIPARVDVAGAA